ncbi:hypothetical protein CLAIMM_14320 [Cladophialophora immunda]|nr:hypothetical protein CLAIMM_14320 [Cladophialophora immunda]
MQFKGKWFLYFGQGDSELGVAIADQQPRGDQCLGLKMMLRPGCQRPIASSVFRVSLCSSVPLRDLLRELVGRAAPAGDGEAGVGGDWEATSANEVGKTAAGPRVVQQVIAVKHIFEGLEAVVSHKHHLSVPPPPPPSLTSTADAKPFMPLLEGKWKSIEEIGAGWAGPRTPKRSRLHFSLGSRQRGFPNKEIEACCNSGDEDHPARDRPQPRKMMTCNIYNEEGLLVRKMTCGIRNEQGYSTELEEDEDAKGEPEDCFDIPPGVYGSIVETPMLTETPV